MQHSYSDLLALATSSCPALFQLWPWGALFAGTLWPVHSFLSTSAVLPVATRCSRAILDSSHLHPRCMRFSRSPGCSDWRMILESRYGCSYWSVIPVKPSQLTEQRTIPVYTNLFVSAYSQLFLDVTKCIYTYMYS